MRKSYVPTAEHRANISAAMKSRHIVRTIEHRQKISEVQKTRKRGVGAKAAHWKGGRERTTRGYIRVYMPDHPQVDSRGYVLEHRLIMEAHIGRILSPTEVVHHINGVIDDNRIENLMLFSSHGEHIRNHQKKEKK